MEKEQVVPDVIDQVPEHVVEVQYPGGEKVDFGNELTPTQVKPQPTITWPADSDSYYTVLMVDPDAPSRKEPKYREILHWSVGNVLGNDVAKGETFTDYVGSGAPKGSGLHRYIFLIYKQNGKIEFNEPRIDNRTKTGRLNFSTRKYAEKYNLGQPIAGNFFQAQFDEWVLEMERTIKG
ncbi:protein D3-like isoform X2 [Diabrotica virgifera virgifera]|nr:protein D3-like isoform X2 [Diabrotica virgifera virgifera]XP_050497217.1 protein D3-like isoform X2 [Diabrotica virgifera virgifera]